MLDVPAPTTDAGRRLLTAATELFYRHGITAVGVAGIATAAGVTKKTLYDCYGSKSALVAAYLAERHRTWWAALQERVDAAPAPRVLAVFAAYRDHGDLPLELGCAFQRGAAELDGDHPGRAVIVAHKAAVRAEIERLLAEDLGGDRAGLADHLALLLEGATFQRGLDGTPDALDRAAGHARSLLDGAP